MQNQGMAKSIKSQRNLAMSEEQINARIEGMDNVERLAFIVAMTDIQKVVHEMSKEDQKRIRDIAEIAEVIIRMDIEKQKIALAMLSSRIIESETPTSLMRRFNPSLKKPQHRQSYIGSPTSVGNFF